MTTPAQTTFTNYAYNNTAQRWFDTTSGRFVPEATVTGEMRVHQQATYRTLEGLTNAYYNGQISISQWQIGIASELKDAHLAQSMFAVGGKRNMTQANYGRVGGTLRDEYTYLNNFANDILSGKVSQAQAIARIRQYGNATQQSYWREYKALSTVIYWHLGTTERHCGVCPGLAEGSPYKPEDLTQVPGDGSTPCRGHCDCSLSREAA